MKKTSLIFIYLLFLAANSFATSDSQQEEQTVEEQHFRPFTGKVLGSRVRLRVQPNLESHIIRQLKAGDMFIITAEQDDFYAISAPKNLKSYIHRKFILDGQIEGTRVNVRLKPTLESPVVAKLNTGDKIEGTIAAENSKWMEISAPENTRFWVYKDYIENIGGPEIYLRLEKKRQRVENILETATAAIKSELQKHFADIHIDQALNDLNQIAKETEDFPYYAEEAKNLIADTSEEYLQKKIAYLESLTDSSTDIWKRKNIQLKDQIEKQYVKIDEMQQQISDEKHVNAGIQTLISESATPEMQSWEPREAKHYELWALNEDGSPDFDSFYMQQQQKAVILEGVLKPYHQSVKNRPGDYLLINERTNLPIAYLYSTKVNLQQYIGKKVNVRGAKRPNNNFAFPAYYILTLSTD